MNINATAKMFEVIFFKQTILNKHKYSVSCEECSKLGYCIPSLMLRQKCAIGIVDSKGAVTEAVSETVVAVAAATAGEMAAMAVALAVTEEDLVANGDDAHSTAGRGPAPQSNGGGRPVPLVVLAGPGLAHAAKKYAATAAAF